MAAVVRDAGCPWILMHWRGPQPTMQRLAHYDDVVADVRGELGARVDAAVAAGVARGGAGDRPRPGLRQDGGAQLGAADGAALPRRAGAAGTGRRIAQVLPRQPARRRARCATSGRRAREPRRRRSPPTARCRARGACASTTSARRSTPRWPSRAVAAWLIGILLSRAARAWAPRRVSTSSAATGRTSSSTWHWSSTRPRPPAPTTSPTRCTTASWRRRWPRSWAASR